jgi:hypothetical protein
MSFRLEYGNRQPASSSVASVLEEIRAALHNKPHGRADIGSILALYGNIVSLCARAKRIKTIITNHCQKKDENVLVLDDLTTREAEQFSGFFTELLEFGSSLSEINISVIDIFYPGLKNDLMAAVGRDIDFSWYYGAHIAPKYKFTVADMPRTLFMVLDKFDCDWGPQNMGGHLLLEFKAKGSGSWGDRDDGLFSEYRDIPTEIFVNNFLEISDTLERCRQIIGDIVREHWNFRDLADAVDRRPVNIEGGLHVAENQYNISNAQVAAIGPHAHAHDVQFQQRLIEQSRSIDLSALSEQLDRLKVELAQQASEREHYAALVAVSDAAEDARARKGGDALSKLSGVGKWALDLAAKIGTPVAVDAIKIALGVK